MNAAELDAIRARVADGYPAAPLQQMADDRRALLAEVELQYRAAERLGEQVHGVRTVLLQVEDALTVSVGEACGICAGMCCRSSDQPVADGLVRLRLIVGPR